MALGLDVVVVVEAVGSEHLLDLLMRTRGDLVDHRPGEGDLLLVLQVVEEGGGHESVVDPALGIGEDASLDLVAIVRAVVHRLYGEGQLSGLPALVEQCADLAHGEEWLHAACEVGLVEAVALLGDGEGDHLQARVAEDLDEALPVGELGIGLEGLGDAGADLLLDGACRLEADEQGEVVIGGVGLVDDLEVEGLGDDDATIVLACVQGIVEDGSGEGTEDVASAEVYPCRFLGRLLAHGLDIEFGELVALGFPLREPAPVPSQRGGALLCQIFGIVLYNIVEFHNFIGFECLLKALPLLGGVGVGFLIEESWLFVIYS